MDNPRIINELELLEEQGRDLKKIVEEYHRATPKVVARITEIQINTN